MLCATIARSKPERALLLAELLLVGAGLLGLQSCGEAEAVSTRSGRIEQVRVGFGLNPEGIVSSGCAASTFAVRDPIHLSMQVTDATAGAVVRVSVQDVVTHRVAWSEERPVAPGRSYQTFEIGRALAQGRFRAESRLDDGAAIPREFVVHDRRPGVR